VEQEALPRYRKSLPRMAGDFPTLVVYQEMSLGFAFQLASCCPERMWFPLML
jgi:hypothetical protein